jgi:hypothetical protein
LAIKNSNLIAALNNKILVTILLKIPSTPLKNKQIFFFSWKMSRLQQILSFVRKDGSFVKVLGKGFIKGSAGKKLSVRGCGVVRKHDEELGGTVKYHKRPF